MHQKKRYLLQLLQLNIIMQNVFTWIFNEFRWIHNYSGCFSTVIQDILLDKPNRNIVVTLQEKNLQKQLQGNCKEPRWFHDIHPGIQL